MEQSLCGIQALLADYSEYDMTQSSEIKQCENGENYLSDLKICSQDLTNDLAMYVALACILSIIRLDILSNLS